MSVCLCNNRNQETLLGSCIIQVVQAWNADSGLAAVVAVVAVVAAAAAVAVGETFWSKSNLFAF